MTSRPVLITMSVLAGAQILTGGAALGDVIGVKAAGLAILAVAAIQGGMAFYVQNQVTPNVDVAARVTPTGTVVAGPAAEVRTGAIVDVTPAGRT
jgi:hypothetical protein